MDTIKLMEALLYRMPDIRTPLTALNIMNMERKISSSEHPELDKLLKPFQNVKMVSVVGYTQLTAIFDVKKVGRRYPVIWVNGYQSEIIEIGKTGIITELQSHLVWKDYLPPPFVKKIIYFDEWNDKSVKGVVFSEWRKNEWTLDNPLNMEVSSSQKIGGKTILTEILNNALE